VKFDSPFSRGWYWTSESVTHGPFNESQFIEELARLEVETLERTHGKWHGAIVGTSPAGQILIFSCRRFALGELAQMFGEPAKVLADASGAEAAS